ncbi:tyrosine-type recombinase/integrase [Mesorhizobium sp. M0809]|uniref:tyrosine-type recombinase/integrase n=1 Tax=Mesorhizobium sp. M0809 TaxID=2957003 RepID=UPI0033388479
MLRAWLAERRGRSADPAFPTISGTSLSHDALQYLLNKHLAVARRHCPSLASKHVTPHLLRHTLAMDLLQHGVDRSVIALWLGHESVETIRHLSSGRHEAQGASSGKDRHGRHPGWAATSPTTISSHS